MFGEPVSWAVACEKFNGLSAKDPALDDGSEAGDWSLPNLAELVSLRDMGMIEPAFPIGLPDRSEWDYYDASIYWTSTTTSSTPYAIDDSMARSVDFWDGAAGARKEDYT